MTIENLQIEVQATSEQASNTLERLEAVLIRIDAIGNRTGFDKLHQKLKKIASIDFANTEKALTSPSKTADKFSRASDGMSKFTKAAKQMRNEVRSISGEYAKHGNLFQTLSADNAAKINTDFLTNFGSTQTKSIPDLKNQFIDLDRIIEDATISTKDFSFEIEKTDKQVKKTNKTFSAMKTILMYSLLFSAVSVVMKGVSEGMQNIATHSEEANEVLTELKTTTTELKNSIGTALIPVLQTLTPLIRIGANVLIDIANAVNVLFSALNGSDSFIKAKKYTDDYAKSLGKVKGLVGMDQIHTIGKSSNQSEMFEKTDIDTDGILTAFSTLAVGVGAFTILQEILTGKTWISGVQNLLKMGTNAKSVGTVFSKLTPITSSFATKLLGGAGLMLGISKTYKAGYEFAKSNKSLKSSLTSLVTGTVSGALGGAAIGGPMGAVVGGLGALASATIGAVKGQWDLEYQMRKTDYYNVQGTAITEVKDALQNYFDSMDFDKHREWVKTIDESQQAYDDAKDSYDLLWESLSEKSILDVTDIDSLTTAFNNLADAAKAVNDAKIGSLMASIKTGIEMNITDDLSDRLGGLLDKIQDAQLILGTKINDLNSKYQSIMNEIATNNNSATKEQKEELQSIRDDLVKFSLGGDASTETWKLSINDALDGAIHAGTDADSVIANIQNLMKDRDIYLTDLKNKYAADAKTLKQLIEMDKTIFKGQLNISEEDFAVFETEYQNQRDEVYRRYNEVVQNIIDTYESNALPAHRYELTDPVLGTVDNIMAGLTGLFGWAGLEYKDGETGWDYLENKALAQEQQEFLKELEKYLLPGYATGGFPEDGLFMANSGELVGKFTNGKTAVANNEQIIEGIKRGVKEANMESGGNGGDWIIQLVDTDGRLKSENIITAAERKNRRDGKTIIPVGT